MSTNKRAKNYYSTNELIELLDISRPRLYGLIALGRLPAYHISHEYRVLKADFDEFLASEKQLAQERAKARRHLIRNDKAKRPAS